MVPHTLCEVCNKGQCINKYIECVLCYSDFTIFYNFILLIVIVEQDGSH
jgi:hypothetical protein